MKQYGIVPMGLELKRDVVGKSGHIQIKPEVTFMYSDPVLKWKGDFCLRDSSHS